MLPTDEACRLILHFSNENISNLVSLTKEQCSSFLGRLSSLTLQIAVSRVREEWDLGQAAQLSLPGDGGVTRPGLSHDLPFS